MPATVALGPRTTCRVAIRRSRRRRVAHRRQPSRRDPPVLGDLVVIARLPNSETTPASGTVSARHGCDRWGAGRGGDQCATEHGRDQSAFLRANHGFPFLSCSVESSSLAEWLAALRLLRRCGFADVRGSLRRWTSWTLVGSGVTPFGAAAGMKLQIRLMSAPIAACCALCSQAW